MKLIRVEISLTALNNEDKTGRKNIVIDQDKNLDTLENGLEEINKAVAANLENTPLKFELSRDKQLSHIEEQVRNI